VSLLLDALKRAEQEKLAKQGERPANDARAAQAAAPKLDSASAASLELQPLANAANAANAGPAKQAATAQAVFQAKATPAPTEEGSHTTKILLIAGSVILFLILVIGGYFWWTLSSLTPQITTLPKRTPATGAVTAQAKADTLVPGAIAPATQRTDPASAGAAPATSASMSAAPTATSAGAAATGAAAISAAPEPRAEDAAPAARNRPEAAARLVREAPSAPSLLLAPTPTPRVPAEIAAGYAALRAGDIAAARRSYTAAYGADSSSIDANLGLATVEARLGNVGAAGAHYRRVLDADPGNATALAGLASMADMSQPEQLERQLRADIARYPQSAALRFALGNLYSSRGRWEDAQAAFFEALRLEPANPDALYNLAVAMDHMGQPRLAADYYGRAVTAAHGRNPTFDPLQAERRIAELRP